MLRPAPYPGRDRLERIYRAVPRIPSRLLARRLPRSETSSKWLRRNRHLRLLDISLSESGKPAEMAVGLRISANLFSTLGARPQLGRDFLPEEEIPGNHRVLIISERYWQDHFGGDGHVIGRAVRVDGESYDIVGVMPATFSDWRHLGSVDVFRPLGLRRKGGRDRNSTWVRLIGRRSAGGTRGRPRPSSPTSAAASPTTSPPPTRGAPWRTVPIDESFLPPDARQILAMLVGLSGLVLLIACSNLANLFLARTMAARASSPCAPRSVPPDPRFCAR